MKKALSFCRKGFFVSYLRVMLSKSKTRQIRLLKLSKYRKERGMFIAEGTINVTDFLTGSLEVLEVYARKEWLSEHKQLLKGIYTEAVTTREMEKISALKNPSEVLAVIKKPTFTLPDIRTYSGLMLALDDIKDPGNLGTIIRTADWFGIRNIICSEETVDAYNPKVVQATMGSLARVRIHYTNLPGYFANKPEDLKVFGAVLNGNDIREAEKPGKGILLIGSEAHGISRALYPFIDERIRIPAGVGSGAESLNAAVATAIACYEFRRKENKQ